MKNSRKCVEPLKRRVSIRPISRWLKELLNIEYRTTDTYFILWFSIYGTFKDICKSVYDKCTCMYFFLSNIYSTLGKVLACHCFRELKLITTCTFCSVNPQKKPWPTASRTRVAMRRDVRNPQPIHCRYTNNATIFTVKCHVLSPCYDDSTILR